MRDEVCVLEQSNIRIDIDLAVKRFPPGPDLSRGLMLAVEQENSPVEQAADCRREFRMSRQVPVHFPHTFLLKRSWLEVAVIAYILNWEHGVKVTHAGRRTRENGAGLTCSLRICKMQRDRVLAILADTYRPTEAIRSELELEQIIESSRISV